MRKAVILLAFVLLVLSGLSIPVAAQGPTPTPNPDCKPADVITRAAALKSTGDNKQDMDALIKLAADIETANIACNGFSWSGTGAMVTDPFILPKGAYRMKLTVSDKTAPFLGSIQGVGDSHCYESVAEDKLVAKLDVLSDCHASLVVDSSSGDWTITLEPLK